MQSALARLRASSWVDRIGLALVGLVVVWLIVNFIKDPVEFVNVGIIGPGSTRSSSLRSRRGVPSNVVVDSSTCATKMRSSP